MCQFLHGRTLNKYVALSRKLSDEPQLTKKGSKLDNFLKMFSTRLNN